MRGWLTCISISRDSVYKKIHVRGMSVSTRMLSRCHLAAKIVKKEMEPLLDLLAFKDCAFLHRLSRDTCSVVRGSSCRSVDEGYLESGDCHCCGAPHLVASLTSPQPRQEELIWQYVNNLLDL